MNDIRLTSRLATALLAALLFGVSTQSRAQTGEEEGVVTKILNAAAEGLYAVAWPSATYKHFSINGVSAARGGFDARITLDGTSAMDGSDLWTELIVEFRNGRIEGLHWGRNNAVLFQPGEFLEGVGKTLVELNRQYEEANSGRPPRAAALPPAATPRATICVRNPTRMTIGYTMSWAGLTDERTLGPGEARIYAYNSDAPEFWMTFDDSADPGITRHTVRLTAAAGTPDSSVCDEVTAYDFEAQGASVGVMPSAWMAGFEHPFVAHVVSTSKPRTWRCAPGYQWVAPEDQGSLACIASSTR